MQSQVGKPVNDNRTSATDGHAASKQTIAGHRKDDGMPVARNDQSESKGLRLHKMMKTDDGTEQSRDAEDSARKHKVDSLSKDNSQGKTQVQVHSRKYSSVRGQPGVSILQKLSNFADQAITVDSSSRVKPHHQTSSLNARVYKPINKSRTPISEKFLALYQAVIDTDSKNVYHSDSTTQSLKERHYRPVVANKMFMLQKTSHLMSTLAANPRSSHADTKKREYKPIAQNRRRLVDKAASLIVAVSAARDAKRATTKERSYSRIRSGREKLAARASQMTERVLDYSLPVRPVLARDYIPIVRNRKSVLQKLFEGIPKILQSPRKTKGPLLITAAGSRLLRVDPKYQAEKQAEIIKKIENGRDVQYMNHKSVELEKIRKRNQDRVAEEKRHLEERYDQDLVYSSDHSKEHRSREVQFRDEVREYHQQSATRNRSDVSASRDMPNRVSSNKHTDRIKHDRVNSHYSQLLDDENYQADYIRREDMRQIRNRAIERERQAFIESAQFVERMNKERKDREMRLQRQKDRLMKKMDEMHNRIKMQAEIRKARHDEEMFIIKQHAVQDRIVQQKVAARHRQADNEYSNMVCSTYAGCAPADQRQGRQRAGT